MNDNGNPITVIPGLKTPGIDQSYIRWDALSALINAYLIPQSEKGTTPTNIVTDRIYDLDKDTSKLDPLLFCPIINYTSANADNELLDFSCDANICILPLQFEQNLSPDASVGTDLLGITDTLGYIPDLATIPTDLIASMYGYDEGNISKSVLYKGENIFSGGEENRIKLNSTDKLRRIGSIFLNIPMLLNIAEKNADNESYTIGMFIKDIWKAVNKVCPNHNFVLTDDKESNVIFIIDLPVDNSEVPMDLHEFVPFSNKNILRNFEYTSNVPSAMSATIAIQAQDPRSITDIDGVTFAAFNKSIKNRILSKDSKSTWEKTKADMISESSKLILQQKNLIRVINQYQSSFFQNIKLSDMEEATIGDGNIIGSLKTYQKNSAFMATTQKGSNSFNSVIPLEFNATLDGISGIVIGNMFKVQKDRLPTAYKYANIGFILFNEEQKITAGGDWTTDIGGKMTILPEKKITIKGVSTSIPAGVDEYAGVETGTSVTIGDSDTTSLDLGQGNATDINLAVVNTPIYLKRIKSSVTNVDGNYISGNNGWTTLRGTYESRPRSQNENRLYYDNAFGMINSWDNGGMYLGTVKSSLDPLIRDQDNYDQLTGRYGVKFNNGASKVLPSKVQKYFQNLDGSEVPQSVYNSSAFMLPNTWQQNTPALRKIDNPEDNDPNTYLNASVGTIVVVPVVYKLKPEHKNGILLSDTTPNRETWLSISFDKKVNDVFLKGYVRSGERIDSNGADYAKYLKNTTLSEYTRTSTNAEYSDVWMRFDTIATTAESANEAFIEDTDYRLLGEKYTLNYQHNGVDFIHPDDGNPIQVHAIKSANEIYNVDGEYGTDFYISKDIQEDGSYSLFGNFGAAIAAEEFFYEPVIWPNPPSNPFKSPLQGLSINDALDKIFPPPSTPTLVTYNISAISYTDSITVTVTNNIDLPTIYKPYAIPTYTQDSAIAEMEYNLRTNTNTFNNISYPKTGTTYP